MVLHVSPRTVFVLPHPFIPMTSTGWIFIAGVLALALSLYLWFSGNPQAAIFVGLWVPSLWILTDLVGKMEATSP
jgi:hypothetical protein